MYCNTEKKRKKDKFIRYILLDCFSFSLPNIVGAIFESIFESIHSCHRTVLQQCISHHSISINLAGT